MEVSIFRSTEMNVSAIVYGEEIVASCGPFILTDAVFKTGFVSGKIVAASDVTFYHDVDIYDEEAAMTLASRVEDIKSFELVVETEFGYFTTKGSEVLYSDILINLQNIWLMPIYGCDQ